MAITAATLSSYAMNETLIDQTDQTDNNTIVVSDDIQTAGNGDIVGTDYIGRVLVLNLNGTEQTRYIINDIAGTTVANSRVLTVSEDWVTNPVVTTDTVHVFYNMEDLNGVTSYYNTRTGFYELSNPIIVGNGADPAGLWIGNGDLVEIEDSKSATVYSLEIPNAGRLQVGYLLGGAPVAGGYLTGINNSQGETWTIFSSGSEGRLYDARFIAGLNPLQFNAATGSDVRTDNFSIFQGTDEGIYFGSTLENGSITGSTTTTEIIRVNASSYFNNVAIISTDGLQTAAGDTTTETLTQKGTTFIGNNNYITLNSNKTWNMINPTWAVTIYTDFVWTTGVLNYVYDQRSIDAVIQKSDGTKLQNTLVIVYESTITDNLEVVLVADVDGVVSGAFDYKFHSTNTSTTTYGGHALRVFNYTYSPFIATQISTEQFSGALTLIPDSAISEQTQATAITNGSGILPVRHGVGETDIRPMKVLNYDGGTGSVPTVGETITSGTATGVVVEYLGDAVSGTIVLDTWNGTEFTNDTAMTGGASSFVATTHTSGGGSFYQEYTWEIDCSSKSLQIAYDYLAAKMADYSGSPLAFDAVFEQLHEWGKDVQGQALYSGGSGYFTEQSLAAGSPALGEGVWLSNRGSGTIAYMTSDADVQYTPPASYTFSITGVETDSEVRIIQNNATRDFIDGTENTTGGVTKAAISSAGSGYTVSDILTIIGGTGTAAQLTVTSVSGGQVTGVSITNPGVYSVNPTNPVSVTGGTGTGATFRLTLSGSFSYTYVYSTDIDMYVVIFHLDYKDLRIIDQVLGNSDQSILIQQQTDRVYSNS
jgi:hypothetical protein